MWSLGREEFANFRSAIDALLGHPTFRRSPLRLIWRAVVWTAHCAVRLPADVVFTSGARLELPPKYLRGGSGAIFVFREDYEPELAHLALFLKAGMTFVDGGANIGIYSAIASAIVGTKGRVLAFEPAEGAFGQLSINAGFGIGGNITPFQMALSDATGEQQLYHSNGGPVGYSLGSVGQEGGASESVHTTRLDDVVSAAGIDRVDVIKLDVEGAEELALRGAENVLKVSRPVVIFEYQPMAPLGPGQTYIGAWMYLREHGYSLHTVAEDGELHERSEPRVGNNIALPVG